MARISNETRLLLKLARERADRVKLVQYKKASEVGGNTGLTPSQKQYWEGFHRGNAEGLERAIQMAEGIAIELGQS